MSSYLRLDKHLILNRLGWRSEVDHADEHRSEQFPDCTPGHLGVLCGLDLDDIEDTVVVVNRRVSAPLDCSIEPMQGQYMYHAHVAVSPRLLEVAEVTCPTIVFPGQGRVQPMLHIRGLRKFDLADFSWVASIHLVD